MRYSTSCNTPPLQNTRYHKEDNVFEPQNNIFISVKKLPKPSSATSIQLLSYPPFEKDRKRTIGVF
jgi:hypothetical protein